MKHNIVVIAILVMLVGCLFVQSIDAIINYRVKRMLEKDFESRITDDKCVYTMIPAAADRANGLRHARFVVYYDEDDTLTIYLIGYASDGEFVKNTILWE